MDQICKCLKCGFIGLREDGAPDIHTGNNCNGKLMEVPLSLEEYNTISCAIIKIFLNDADGYFKFMDAMIELKENDIVEYGLKYSQLQMQAEQRRASMAQASFVLKCPTCHSTQVRKIDVVERAGSVAFLGIFSKKINKSFKCKNCGYTW